jgi:transposase-like protein
LGPGFAVLVRVVHNCPKIDRFSYFRPKFVRFGSYFRTSDSRSIQRFRCCACRHTFSTATGSPCFGQKKRRINEPLRELLASGISLRRSAIVFRVHRTTIARRLVFLGIQARLELDRQLSRFRALSGFQFDDLETFEHAKSKPLSVTLAVSLKRKILAFEVSSMPAKGPLAKIGRKRYGFRPDHRSRALKALLSRIRPVVSDRAVIRSDRCPRYPGPVARLFPNARHETVKGRRGCVTGQGELKRGGFDPLFSLNHTCAMLRANVNRLFRRTWCTTKKAQALAHHLAIYADYHNSVLTDQAC